MPVYEMWVDGGLSASGTAYGSFVVYKLLGPDRKLLCEHVRRMILRPRGTRITSGMAEVWTLYLALGWVRRNTMLVRKDRLRVFMDSKQTLAQLTGRFRVGTGPQRRMYEKIYTLLKGTRCLEEITQFRWISGEEMKKTVIGH
jgi:ribonuclease HI